MHATYPVHLILLDLVTLLISGKTSKILEIYDTILCKHRHKKSYNSSNEIPNIFFVVSCL